MFIRTIKNPKDLKGVLARMDVDPTGSAIMSGKSVTRVIDIPSIDTRAANILKQEALSAGADVALPKSACGYKEERVQAVLMATDRQLNKIVQKLKAQPYGLKGVAADIEALLVNFAKDEFELVSPHARVLKLKDAVVMGILNTTPDSFSDGGEHDALDDAVARALEMVAEGAAIIDIGGEATGPGSVDVSVEDELARVIPVIEAVRKELPDTFISVDTYKSEVAEKAIEAGADMINDVTAGRGDERLFELVKDVPLVVMYSKDPTARTTGDAVEYDDVMETIIAFLGERIVASGASQVIVDPGMSAFVSANYDYSYDILRRLEELKCFGLPILIGASRKSFIPEPLEERAAGSVAAACAAAMNGAKIIRAHDVKETTQALKVINQL